MTTKVRVRKWGGDDHYSWAVFVNNQVIPELTGLSRYQARYYADKARVSLKRSKTEILDH